MTTTTDLFKPELDRLEAVLRDLQRVTEEIRLAQEELDRKRRQQFLDETRAEDEIEYQRLETKARRAADEALLEKRATASSLDDDDLEALSIGRRVVAEAEEDRRKAEQWVREQWQRALEQVCPKGPKL